ncbi:hypothetical protein KIPB_006047 [Kipferlia bialata]|uniref:SET domain-containing protein n=1 Tax=Kipferlia bialata TaxID=797122 RepID=A0A9K3GIY5_9EUKA|nr:hypothetical protein KIPB_006047 [Kipferlia bialata]|eukprot:g6047.t1
MSLIIANLELPLLVDPTPVNMSEGGSYSSVAIQHSYDQQLRAKGKWYRDAFFSLSDHTQIERGGGPKIFGGICRTNMFGCEAPLREHNLGSCCCLEASMLNHSCVPNVSRYWDESSGEMVFHSTRDIDAGEELTISYISRRLSRAERKEKLAGYSFECQCPLCTLSDEESESVDALIQVHEDTLTKLSEALKSERYGAEVEYWAKELVSIGRRLYIDDIDGVLQRYFAVLAIALGQRNMTLYGEAGAMAINYTQAMMGHGNIYESMFTPTYFNPATLVQANLPSFRAEFPRWWKEEGRPGLNAWIQSIGGYAIQSDEKT